MEQAWMHDAKELKRQRAALLREIATALQCLRKESPAAATELESVGRCHEDDCSKERVALFQQCDRVKAMRVQLRGLVTSDDSSAGALKKLRLLVTSLETAVTVLRDSQRRTYEALRKEESDVTSELAAFEVSMQSWPQPPAASASATDPASTAEGGSRSRVGPPPPPSSAASSRARSSSVGAPHRAGRGSARATALARPPTPPGAPSSAHTHISSAAGGSGADVHWASAGMGPRAADGGVDTLSDEEDRAVAARARLKLDQQRKQAALEVYRLQKQAQALREQTEAQAAVLREHQARVLEAERQARKRAAVEQYRAEKEQEVGAVAAAQRVRTHTPAPTPAEAEAAKARAAYYIELAASKHREVRVEASAPLRSERYLAQAALSHKLAAQTRPHTPAHVTEVADRLHHSTTAAAQMRVAAARADRAAHSESAQASAHAQLVPSCAGADRSRGISYTFGTGSARAVPAWRGGT